MIKPSMQTFSANDAKQNLGAVIDAALQKPVVITKHGRPAVVVTSEASFRELQQLVQGYLKAEIRKGIDDIQAGRFRAFETHDDLKKLFLEIKSDVRLGTSSRSAE